MKRTAITIYLLFATVLSAFAEVITENRAAEMAAAFFGGGKMSPAYASSPTKSVSLEAPAYHIFNRTGGGWVIVSGEDSVQNILAYGDEGSFQTVGMPDNLSYWLGEMERQVSFAREHKAAVSGTVKTSTPRTAGTPVVLLETAKWDQEDPFNLKCPVVTGEKGRAMTGCVATAMGIVLRYNQWPPNGTGTLSSYRTESKGYKVNGFSIDGYEYDYSQMPLNSGRTWTSAQEEAVSTFLYHLGVMVQMDYGYDGSGAYSENIAPALINHMSYSTGANLYSKDDYSKTKWIGMLKAELDAGRPILYGGCTRNNEGHQFVFDGYDTENYFHVNWGWSGQGNGYFTVDALGNTSTVGATFNYYQDAVLNLIPNETGKSAAVFIDKINRTDNGLYYVNAAGTVPKPITSGMPFKMSVASLINKGTVAAKDVYVKMALTDKDGKFIEFISDEKSVGSIAAGADVIVKDIICTLHTGPKPG